MPRDGIRDQRVGIGHRRRIARIKRRQLRFGPSQMQRMQPGGTAQRQRIGDRQTWPVAHGGQKGAGTRQTRQHRRNDARGDRRIVGAAIVDLVGERRAHIALDHQVGHVRLRPLVAHGRPPK